MFDAIAKGNEKEIQRLSKEKLLVKQLGGRGIPNKREALESLVVNKILHNAIDAGYAAKVKKLLANKFFSRERKYKVDIESQDYTQTTPLMDAVQTGNMNMVKFLVKEGVDVNVQNAGCQTALILAAQLGQEEMANHLIANGSILGLVDRQGKNALMWAAQSNQAEVVRALMDRDANPFNPDNESMNP